MVTGAFGADQTALCGDRPRIPGCGPNEGPPPLDSSAVTSPTPRTRAAAAAATAVPTIAASGRALQRRFGPEELLRLALAALLVLAAMAVIAFAMSIRVDPPTATDQQPATAAPVGAEPSDTPPTGAAPDTIEPSDTPLPAPAAPTTVTTVDLAAYPSAAADAIEVEDDKDARIFVLANDAQGGAPLDISTLEIVGTPELARDVEVTGDHIRYKAEKDASGTDRFDYVICNLDDLCATARVTITVIS